MLHSQSLPINLVMTAVLVIMVHLSALVCGLPLTRRGPQEDSTLYRQLEDAINQAILHSVPFDPSASAPFKHLSLPPPQNLLRDTPTDTPSLTDLMRSAVPTEFKRPDEKDFKKTHGQEKPVSVSSRDATGEQKGGSTLEEQSGTGDAEEKLRFHIPQQRLRRNARRVLGTGGSLRRKFGVHI